MIKAIIFDFFGVLTVDVWKEFVESLPKEQQDEARNLNKEVDASQISIFEFASRIENLTGYSKSSILEIITPTNDHRRKNQRLFSYIRLMKPKYKIGLLSNVASDWILKSFLDNDEQAIFDEIVLSFDIKKSKPDPEVYKITAQRLGVKPEECIMIDDSLRNCQGAEQAGMRMVVYENYDQCINQLEKTLK